MIEKISVSNLATFTSTAPQVLRDLCRVNYIFGSNGTGKTTISRVIADPAFNANCKCTWKAGRQIETLVLNRDFVERNLLQLRGVFTLGEEALGAEQEIEAAKREEKQERDQFATLKRTLEGEDGTGGKIAELAQLEGEYRDKFWHPVERIKKEGKLVGALTGILGNKSKCKDRILDEIEQNSASLRPLADLEKRAETIFGSEPAKESALPNIDCSKLLGHESNPILKKKVFGKADVDIATMIHKLGNSDWVRQGLPYYEKNDNTCPFCQQETTENFAQSLKDYFDEAFVQDTNAIDVLISQHASDASEILTKIAGILASPHKFLDAGKMATEKATLEQTINANTLRLDNKKKEPSRVVEIDSIKSPLMAIEGLIDAANVEVTRHNAMVENLGTEKKALVSEVWRFILNELGLDIKQYGIKRIAVEKAIAGLNEKINGSNDRIREIERQIRELEKSTTSIQPTIDAIHHTLQTFGFDSFVLADSGDGKHYKLIRANGEDARETLSEGEKAFVVFLYFYHLLKGSFSEAGITTDRVVAFDDPVSSLDSDVLFIVSSLIKEVCENCRTGIGNIKQVFVLTHNVYFHREVTYNSKRASNGTLSEESFWIVRKSEQYSKVDRHDYNPIKTSYELLWMEVREAQEGGNVSLKIGNTLRRILEHYFTILGSIDRDSIIAKFRGQDQLVCKSLFSWVNAGSHSALDDAHVTPSDTLTRSYLRVFKSIYKDWGHIAHYNMMMGLPDE